MIQKKRLLPLGDTLLEIIIASALITIGLISILSLSTRSQKSTDFSRDTNIATNYSYQAIDWLRDLRNNLGYPTFTYYLSEDSANPVVYCLNSDLPTTELEFEALTSSACAPNNFIDGTIFSREISIDISNLTNDYITGIVTTTWEGNKTYTNAIEIKLTKWQ